MRVKDFFFVIFFLAAASLGFALPTIPVNPDSTVSQVQSILTGVTNVSQECGEALLSIVTNPELLECMPFSALLPMLPIITDPQLPIKFKNDPAGTYKTIEGSVLSFAAGICAAPKCSDDFIKGAIQTIQDGCKNDLESDSTIQLLLAVAVFYSPVRDIICFKDNSQFCFDQTTLKVLSLPPSPFKITNITLIDSIAVGEPTDICTICNKDMVNTIFNFLNDKNNELALEILKNAGIDEEKIQGGKIASAVKCGAKFVDGKIST